MPEFFSISLPRLQQTMGHENGCQQDRLWRGTQQLVLLALTSTERHIAAWFGTLAEQSSNLLAYLAVLTRSQTRTTDIGVPQEDADRHSEEEKRVGTPKESTVTHDSICLHDYMSRYGRFDEIHTDPGTDFKSKILEQLNKWYGITHVFSLIDRHESNGAKRVIKEVIRHLAALVNDERVVKRWAEPDYISSVRLLCNSTPLSERGGY